MRAVGILMVLIIAGCANASSPSTNVTNIDLKISSDAWQKSWQTTDDRTPKRILVWSDNPAVRATLTDWMVRYKHGIPVERAKLEEILAEQRRTLLHGTDLEADLLKVGGLLGADYILFGEVDTTNLCPAGSPPYQLCYFMTVRLRGVWVDTGAVTLTAEARNTYPANSYLDRVATQLTHAAFTHSICNPAKYIWHEPTPSTKIVTDMCEPRVMPGVPVPTYPTVK